MRYAILAALALSIPLPGCAGFPTSPQTIANHTTADEKAAIAIELAYTTATKMGTALARAGFIDPAYFAKLDNKAYTALLAARSAYKAGNAAGYDAAVTELNSALRDINSLAEKVS